MTVSIQLIGHHSERFLPKRHVFDCTVGHTKRPKSALKCLRLHSGTGKKAENVYACTAGRVERSKKAQKCLRMYIETKMLKKFIDNFRAFRFTVNLLDILSKKPCEFDENINLLLLFGILLKPFYIVILSITIWSNCQFLRN